MDELASHTSIRRMGEWGGVVNYGGGDSSMVVMFYMKAVSNPAKSAEVGRPYFDDKIYVRIHPPGERLNIVDREATDLEKRRYPMQWQQFQQNAPQVADGTPVDMLFAASPATAGALKASGVHTVEQLAKLSAHAIETIGMGCQQWVNEAVRYLEVANKGVKASQLKQILEEKDREIHSLKNKLELVQSELKNIRANQENAVTMADVQQLLANQGGGMKRGVFSPGGNFDAQTAQINAVRQMPKADPKRSRTRLK